MGCGGSKIENLPLVALCKERKGLIRAASDCRYDLATAHVLYSQSLSNVGSALNRFVEEELLIVLDPPEVPICHDDSSEKNSHLVFSSSDSLSEPNSGSLTDYVHRDSKVGEGPEPRPHRNTDQPRVNLNVHHQRKTSAVKLDKIYEQQQVVTFEGQESSNSFARYSKCVSRQPSTHLTALVHDNTRHTHDNNYKHKSTPLDLHSRFIPNGYTVSSGATLNIWHNEFTYPQYENGDSRLYQYGYERSFGGSTDVQSNYSYNNHALGVSPVRPPTPAPPEIPAWDYLNPFSVIDDLYFDHDDHDRDETGSGSDNHNLREVREKEGIPELEDEIDKHSVHEVFEERESEGDMRRDSVCGASRAEPSKAYEDGTLAKEKENKQGLDRFETQEKDNKNPETSDKDTKHSSETFISNNFEDAMDEGLGSNQALSLEGKASESMPIHGSKDVHDVMKEIQIAFETAYDYGKEVSALLEAGKLPYQCMGSKLKEFSSWILSFLSVSVAASSQPQTRMRSKRSSSRLRLIAKAHDGGVQDDICRKFGDLSSTLEKLYAWEKKLHEEVMGEEKLRIAYDKKCKRLKDLDDRGEESSKMDKVQASINRLLSKINVAIAAVDIISTRICKLRDEELYPQLTELIEGMMKMWKSLVSCHHKQFQDIINIQSYFHKAKVGIKDESSSKATLNLEVEITSLGAHFTAYVESQKAFVRSLNEWLTRCLLREPEETPNGIAPFSPSRIRAPPVFVACNDWYNAIEKTSGAGVSKAILNLSSSLHLLRVKQDEEHHQRLKFDYLSKDLDQRLKYIGEERSVQHDKDASQSLVSMRKRLSEQKAKHEEAVRKVNELASHCMEVDMVSIFEALESFSVDSLRAYEQLRIVKEGGREVHDELNL